MDNKPIKVTSVDLAHRVDNEGLSYAVQHYYGENIECVDSPRWRSFGRMHTAPSLIWTMNWTRSGRQMDIRPSQ
jgi:hypothetical protein